MRKIFIIMIVFLWSGTAAANGSALSAGQVERVKTVQTVLGEVDKKTLDQTIADLEESPSPDGNLKILEAVAETYAEIVSEQDVTGIKKKEWLYSMIQLNMAYFQLGGNTQGEESSLLNRLIQQKLKRKLSPEVLADEEIFHSLDK